MSNSPASPHQFIRHSYLAKPVVLLRGIWVVGVVEPESTAGGPEVRHVLIRVRRG